MLAEGDYATVSANPLVREAYFASLDVEENLLLPPTVRSGGMSLDEIYAMFPNLYERRERAISEPLNKNNYR